MNREEAKQLFKSDKDSYGKPKAVVTKINKIFDDFDVKIKEIQDYKDAQEKQYKEDTADWSSIDRINNIHYCSRIENILKGLNIALNILKK
jgi:hypothetical protein